MESKKGGTFTVKFAYLAIGNYAYRIIDWPWKFIWKTNAPTKVLCFTWLVARKEVLTRRLRRRGFHLCSRCLFCELNSKTNSHLFLHCSFTYQLWQLFLNLVGIKWYMPANTLDLLKSWNNLGGIVRQKK